MIGALVVQHLFSTSGRAFEQRDTEALLSSWADDVVFEFGGAGGMSGHFAGKEAVRGWFHRWFERMDSLEMKVRHVGVARPWALGLSNTVLVEFVVDETSHDGISVHTEGVTVYDVRHGKVVRARNYLFDERSETTMRGESQIG